MPSEVPATCYADYLAEDTFVIFLLHGVIPEHTEPFRNYTRKHIDIARFTEVLNALQTAGGRAIFMEQVSNGDIPPRAFALTFDDGFANNYYVAAPILRERQLPATFYITTRFVNERTGSWTDRLERSLQHEQVEVATRIAEFSRSYVKSHPKCDPDSYVDAIEHHFGVGPTSPSLDFKMTWAELQTLAKDPLFTIGGHGHTHRILSYLTHFELKEELNWCFGLLDSHQLSTKHFSYPEGQASHYSLAVVQSLKRYGITCCPTAIPGVNSFNENPFHLKRIPII